MDAARWSRRLFAAVALFLVAFGLLYATRQQMLFFHAAAVPEAARADVLELCRALMRLIGGASIGLGLLALWVIRGPFRAGVPGTAAALLVALTIPLFAAGVTAELLARNTGAPTAWYNMGVLFAIAGAAFLLDRRARR
jgi:uncharacterized protein YjeT (DUF2065 family)